MISCSTNPSTKINEKPNIVFIMADDHASGHKCIWVTTKLAPTPNIDRIAKNGMLMNGLIAQTPFVAQVEHPY